MWKSAVLFVELALKLALTCLVTISLTARLLMGKGDVAVIHCLYESTVLQA